MQNKLFSRISSRKLLQDGQYLISPPFNVPSHIPRPHPRTETLFAQKVRPSEVPMLRESAKIAASALQLALSLAVPGTTTDHIDQEVSRYIVGRGAFPSGIGFMGFPKSICTAVNEVIAHGIPDSRPLQDGDIVNFDVTCYKNGFYGDNSEMALVGAVSAQSLKLVETTREALNLAVDVCKPGAKFSEIGNVITGIAKSNGYQVVEYFCGHFVGREMHISPNVHHTTGVEVMNKLVMEEGMVFTIEPILVEGSTAADVWEDGWTYVTRDKGLTAQCEHMVLITNNGCEVLTRPDEVFPCRLE